MPDRRVVVVEIMFRYALSVVALAKTDPCKAQLHRILLCKIVVVVEIMFRYALSRRSFSEDGSPRNSSAKLANSCAITLLICGHWS